VVDVDDRKRQTRFITDLSCTFGATPDAPRSGKITSLSPTGCFVKTKAIVTKSQDLFLRIWMPENRWLRLRGAVNYNMEGVGFGLGFAPTEDEERADLERLLEGLRRQV
jgi:PilZ domain